jgi:REP element-mobilizing transposase RayT
MDEGRRPHGAELRKGRVSEIGRAYLVTFVVRERRPVFHDFHLGRLVVAELRAADQAGFSETLCFVVMPDHCHWLLSVEAGALSTIVGRVKARSAKTINRLGGNSGPLWQTGFHDHAVREEEDIQSMARYVVANPMRAGLIDRVGDYPLWDAIWL